MDIEIARRAWPALRHSVALNALHKGLWSNWAQGWADQLAALTLVHGEVAEARQALWEGNPLSSHVSKSTQFQEELADIILMVMSASAEFGWRVDAALFKLLEVAQPPYDLWLPPGARSRVNRWDNLDLLTLVTWCVSQAAEAFRKAPEVSPHCDGPPQFYVTDHWLAVAVVQCFMLDDGDGLWRIMEEKVAFNATRPAKHGRVF
jgi:NTP pyrophosphatase (non-canonical NTP hydrolase)